MCLEPSVALGSEENDEEMKGQNDCDQAIVTWQVSWFLFGDFPSLFKEEFNLLGRRAIGPDRAEFEFHLYHLRSCVTVGNLISLY